ncbi:unnamed protein product [Lymnaea stagnalis]|uniref:Uncharacterized protein n=1 Tax=Lymnaea stagnalis TaxID=6523 RepID=A0AAV2H272_LYMST
MDLRGECQYLLQKLKQSQQQAQLLTGKKTQHVTEKRKKKPEIVIEQKSAKENIDPLVIEISSMVEDNTNTKSKKTELARNKLLSYSKENVPPKVIDNNFDVRITDFRNIDKLPMGTKSQSIIRNEEHFCRLKKSPLLDKPQENANYSAEENTPENEKQNAESLQINANKYAENHPSNLIQRKTLSKAHVQPHQDEENFSHQSSVQSSDYDSKSEFRKQLEHDGNKRAMAAALNRSIIKSNPSVSGKSINGDNRSPFAGHGTKTPLQDQHFLGYDWIAAVLDNDSELMTQTESFFNELKHFRKSYKDECCSTHYKEEPHTLIDLEPEPVVDALTPSKIEPYTVNERLFTERLNPGLAEYHPDTGTRGRERTKGKPRFVRVSIPSSKLQSPYRVKPHRRGSFDASDSCSLKDNCLLGWENTMPNVIPYARSMDLNTEARRPVNSTITTLAEAEQIASSVHQAQWPFVRSARHHALSSWKKHYLDMTDNMPLSEDMSSNLSVSRSLSEPAQRKTTTDKLLNSTYQMMYEMERLKEERMLERKKEDQAKKQNTA